MHTQASVARGAASLYAANVAVLIANTGYFLALTNLLRSTLEVGIVTSLNIMIWLLVTVSIMAQPLTLQSPIPAPMAVLRFIPEIITRRSRSAARTPVRLSILLTSVISGIIAILLTVFPNLVAPLLGGEAVNADFVRLSAVDIVFASLAQICVGTMVATGMTKKATVYLVAWSLVRYGLATLLLVPFAITGVLAGFVLGDAFLLALAGLTIATLLGKPPSRGFFSVMKLVTYSAYTVFSALIGFSVSQADKLFTLANQGLRELAVYNVAIVASSFSGFAPFALLSVLLPVLSYLHASRRRNEMRRLIRSYSRYVSIVVMPVAFGLAALMEVALRIFGQDYLGGLLPATVVSLATGVTSVSYVYAGALLAAGEMRWYIAANVMGVVTMLVLSAMLTPILGLLGPAFGRAVLMSVVFIVYAYAVKKSGFLEFDWKAFLCALTASGLMAAVIFMLVSLINSFGVRLVALVPMMLLGLLIYIGVLRGLNLFTAEDVNFFLTVLPRFLHRVTRNAASVLGVGDR